MAESFHQNPWGLTVRECLVLTLVVDHQNKVVADRMCISRDTVSDYLKSAYYKMRVRCRTAAAVRFDRWLQAAPSDKRRLMQEQMAASNRG